MVVVVDICVYVYMYIHIHIYIYMYIYIYITRQASRNCCSVVGTRGLGRERERDRQIDR